MSLLHLFNPENDFALALGRRAYTADRGAVAIRRAGRLLPLWWASQGDAILVDSPDAAAEASALKQKYGLAGEIVTTAPPGYIPEPWGWSHHTRKQFLAAGVAEELMPSEHYLDSLRMLSHRRTAIEVNRLLGTPAELMPAEATSVEEAFAIIDWHFSGNAVVKLPWSSSGRGVIYAPEIPRPTLETYVRGMIRRQGSVTIEPRYNRLRDFAMLFLAEPGGRVLYQGLSTFLTDSRGFYAGNLVAPQSTIAHRIGAPASYLAEPLCRALSTVVAPAAYTGWIGVDMLTYRHSGGKLQIAPCIEINFRRTMGVVALEASRRLHSSRQPALLLHTGLRAL